MTKIKIFTHNDLDGVGSPIIAYSLRSLCLNDFDVDVEYLNYKEVDSTVSDFVNSFRVLGYDKVYIVDISVGKKVAELINMNNVKDYNDMYFITLLDHHQSAEWLNSYEWATVSQTMKGVKPNYHFEIEYPLFEAKECGTTMFLSNFLEYLTVNNFISREELRPSQCVQMDKVRLFASLVRAYDTWEWKEIYNDRTPKRLNDLLYHLGIHQFVDEMVENIISAKPYLLEVKDETKEKIWLNVFDKEQSEIVMDIERNVMKYISAKSEGMIILRNFNGYMVGVVFATEYISELGNALSELHPYLAYIIILNKNSGSVSLRTTKESVNLSKIAKAYGGGGHPKASGIPLNNKILNDLQKAYGKDKEVFVELKLSTFFNKISKRIKELFKRGK